MSNRILPTALRFMGATAAIFVCVSWCAGQPPPPSADAEGVANRAVAGREPGYLGLIADDRREQGAGVRVVKVVEGSPAAKAGLQVNDLITAIGGEAVGSLSAMASHLEPLAAEDKVRFEVRRGESVQAIEVVLGRRPPPGDRPFEFGRIPEPLPEPSGDAPPIAAPSSTAPPAAASRRQLLGIRSGPVGEAVRARLGVPEAGGALVVARVVGSPADKAGIPLDAVIVALDGQAVGSPTDLARLVAAAGPGKEVQIEYYIGRERRKAVVMLANVADVSPTPSGVVTRDQRLAPGPPERIVPEPQPSPERIGQLERRIRELEERVQELERALGRLEPGPPSRKVQ